MDTGCTDGSSGNQPGTLRGDRIPEEDVLEQHADLSQLKPNCSIQSYAPVLTAWKEFEPYEVVATTYQAISGAGKDLQGLAGNGREHHSVHRRRGREEREGAA